MRTSLRHTALATTASVLLLTIPACSKDPVSAARPSPSVTSTAAETSEAPAAPADEPTTAATPAAAKPSATAAATVKYAANTKKVCTKVDNLFEGAGLERFAKHLGSLILYKQAKKPVKAKRSQAKAKQELKTLAASVRTTTATAKNPALKAAGAKSAASIEKSAANNALFNKLKTIKDVDQVLTSEITPWLTPLGLYCT
jgi:hypothetical protein